MCIRPLSVRYYLCYNLIKEIRRENIIMKLLTIDYGGTFVKYGLLDTENGELSGKGKVPAPLESPEAFAETAGSIYEQFRGTAEGVAISMPGIIDSETGLARTAGAYTKMPGQNVYELLTPYIDVYVCIENDGKAAIQAEVWKGALQDVKNGCACIIGSGLGGGVVMDGKLRKGGHFASGEISGLLMNPGDYSFGNYAASAAGMSAFLMQVAYAKGMNPADFEISGYMAQGESSGEKKISGKEVFDWIEAGDEVVMNVYRSWIEKLVLVLYNMKMVLDPEKIVVGGGVSANPRFIRDLKEEYAKSVAGLLKMGFPDAPLDVCHFSSDANLIGAAYTWLQKYGK